jgi:tetratricopeptide (TPR) repeat protein
MSPENVQPAAGDSSPAAALAEARAAGRRCDFAGAERRARSAVVMAEQTQARDTLADALQVLGMSLTDQARYSHAVSPLRRALDIRRDLRDPDEIAAVHHDLLCLEVMRGRLHKAAAHLADADRLYDPGHPRRPAFDGDRAWFALAVGNAARAEHFARRGLDQSPAAVVGAVCAAHLAVAQAMRGESGGFLALRPMLDDAGCGAWPWYGAAWAASLLGRTRNAQELGSTARRIARGAGDEYTRAKAAALVRAVSR